jgi:divalent metal cation (Fe/Co/Zn/Cd) transporter
MDSLPEDIDDKLAETVRSVEGVVAVNSLRVRPSGAKLFVDATIGIRRTVPFLFAHRIMDEVEKAVHIAYPNSDLIVHSEPVEVDGESLADKVTMAAVGLGYLPPHNLEIIEHEGLIFIDFDLEYREDLSFADAHEHSEAVEKEIKRLMPNIGKVTIHLEEYPEKTISIFDDPNEMTDLDTKIRAVVNADQCVLGIGEVILLKVGMRYNLSIACLMDKDATLTQIHQLTRNIASKLYIECPLLRRVIVHAEPKG